VLVPIVGAAVVLAFWSDEVGPLLIVLLAVLPGRATVQEGALHLVLAGAFVFLALVP